MHFPHYPGRVSPVGQRKDKTGRWEWTRDKYSEQQNSIWEALNTAYYAVHENRANTLVLVPGLKRDMARFERWRDRAIAGWAIESRARDSTFTRGVTESDFPPHVWIWLYDRLDAAGVVQDNAGLPVPAIENYYDG
jgi:hypothetical protein